MTEEVNYDLFRWPKWPRNWASEADMQHTSKSSSKCHVNPDWSKARGKILRNDQRLEFLSILGPKVVQNWASETYILHTSKSTCNEHVKQYSCETSENFYRKWPKTTILTYFWPKMVPKLGLWGPYAIHCFKYLQWACEAILMSNQ